MHEGLTVDDVDNNAGVMGDRTVCKEMLSRLDLFALSGVSATDTTQVVKLTYFSIAVKVLEVLVITLGERGGDQTWIGSNQDATSWAGNQRRIFLTTVAYGFSLFLALRAHHSITKQKSAALASVRESGLDLQDSELLPFTLSWVGEVLWKRK